MFQLAPVEFVNLFLTCRFLHWRTYYRCYVPYTVAMAINDSTLSKDCTYRNIPKMIYCFNGEDSTDKEALTQASRAYLRAHQGHREIFVEKPNCLKKPFHFETL